MKNKRQTPIFEIIPQKKTLKKFEWNAKWKEEEELLPKTPKKESKTVRLWIRRVSKKPGIHVCMHVQYLQKFSQKQRGKRRRIYSGGRRPLAHACSHTTHTVNVVVLTKNEYSSVEGGSAQFLSCGPEKE